MSTRKGFTFTLPIPSSGLSPNSRWHWAKKSKAAKSLRNTAKFITLANIGGGFVPWKRASVRARFFFKVKRARDADNALASLKAAFDGMADAGLVANDKCFVHLPADVDGVDAERPRVEIDVAEIEPGRTGDD